MKNCRTVSITEMRQKFPDFMKAMDNPNKAKYCWGSCDGMRVFDKDICVVCEGRYKKDI